MLYFLQRFFLLYLCYSISQMFKITLRAERLILNFRLAIVNQNIWPRVDQFPIQEATVERSLAPTFANRLNLLNIMRNLQ